MSQTVKTNSHHKLSIKNKKPGSISTGANTEVYLDDQRLNGVSFIKLEFKSNKIAKVLLEMYVEAEVESDVIFTSETPKREVKAGDKTYTLTEYSTVGTPFPKK